MYYGYPLVTMEMTRRVITNVAATEGHARADGPVHQAARNIRTPTFRDVTAPNADTLYTTAFVRRRQRALGARASPT